MGTASVCGVTQGPWQVTAAARAEEEPADPEGRANVCHGKTWGPRVTFLQHCHPQLTPAAAQNGGPAQRLGGEAQLRGGHGSPRATRDWGGGALGHSGRCAVQTPPSSRHPQPSSAQGRQHRRPTCRPLVLRPLEPGVSSALATASSVPSQQPCWVGPAPPPVQDLDAGPSGPALLPGAGPPSSPSRPGQE